MNSNLNRALASALVAFGSVAPALAQFDWDGHCIDPNNTAPYSADFITYRLSTDLFGAALGISGTVALGPAANLCGAATAPVVGRIGFTIGRQGSIQDNDPTQDFQGIVDEDMRLTVGMNNLQEFDAPAPAGSPGRAPGYGGFTFARVYTQDPTTGATNSYLFGENGMRLAFYGRSGRYMYAESTVNGTAINNSIGVRCVVDVIGDAARVNWRLSNRLNLTTAASTGTPLGIGLAYANTVALYTRDDIQRTVPFGNGPGLPDKTYTTIPGRRPLTVEERFNRTGLDPDGQALGATIGVPPYVNFSASQAAGFGLQVVNDPSALGVFDPQALASGAIDQTPVDEFVLGEAPFLISGGYGTTNPTIGDFIFNPPGPSAANLNADAAPIGPTPSFVQKWLPTTVVAGGGFRDIVAYYRSTNGDSSYGTSFTGYTAVVDTPKSISTVSGDANSFAPNPFTIRVNVDNTGGFSTVDQFVTMQSVSVTLSLPNGMYNPDNVSQRTITKSISAIGPAALSSVDFRVAVDENAFGALPYTVTISPQPGFATKVINGVINVATTPKLEIASGANLVGPPWQFADNSWETVLGLDLNSDFQAYTWDATTQQYIPQVAVERGRGSFIISNPDLGFKPLGGFPLLPDDQFPNPANNDLGGAPIVQLHRGWNLVANPYNYAFDIGQIVGVPDNSSTALPYTELVNQGYTNGAFTYYDQSQKRYSSPIAGAGSRLQPNYGYWIYANYDFAIQFPPIYDIFIRSAPPKAFVQRFDNWRLQLNAAQTNAADSIFVGTARKAEDSKNLSYLKAPIAPAANAVRSYAVGNSSWGNAQLLRVGKGTQSYAYKVLSKKAGPTTISWPNLREIPTNLAVTLKDAVTGKTVNARSVAGYTYTSSANTERSFTVTVTPKATVAQRVGTASVSQVRKGPVQQMKIAYTLSGRGSTTIRVYDSKRRLLGTVANDVDAVAGANTVMWGMSGANGLPLDAGSYVLEIAATGEAGDTATRQLAITIRR